MSRLLVISEARYLERKLGIPPEVAAYLIEVGTPFLDGARTALFVAGGILGLALFILYMTTADGIIEPLYNSGQRTRASLVDLLAITLCATTAVFLPMAIYSVILLRYARRFLRAGGSPWCTSCGYPLGSIRPDRGIVTCPECSAQIPHHATRQ